MKNKTAIPGTPPPEVSELVRSEDRLSFVYFEHADIDRENNSITVTNHDGTIALPAAAVSVLLLGPGTTITHQAMHVIGENGATVMWVGERGVRLYASGSPLTHSSALLERQASLVSNQRSRLAVARKMYEMRFPGENFSHLTMQQMRGREGARVRSVYRRLSQKTGVMWDKRTYNHEDFNDANVINQALSAANTCMYGICYAAIIALGCSPGLGFIHVGHERSFVFDVADLYKAEVSIPVAFETTALQPDDIGSAVRHAMRDRLYDLSILPRIVHDIRSLFGVSETQMGQSDPTEKSKTNDNSSEAVGYKVSASSDSDDGDFDSLKLWDPHGDVNGGVSY